MTTLPSVYLARHGETAWSLSGQHTGLTDLPLTEHGKRNALLIGQHLAGLTFAKVLTSPLQRAIQTCELAGFGAGAGADSDLVEWNYGDYEGLRTAEIHAEHPDWQLVMLKLTLPGQDDFYAEFVEHPKVLKVVALSGGYSRQEGNDRLRRNHGVVASFSRALVEGLSVQQSEAEFDALLDSAIQSIYEASLT
jgi:broad specificity phosphatase PhoE